MYDMGNPAAEKDRLAQSGPGLRTVGEEPEATESRSMQSRQRGLIAENAGSVEVYNRDVVYGFRTCP